MFTYNVERLYKVKIRNVFGKINYGQSTQKQRFNILQKAILHIKNNYRVKTRGYKFYKNSVCKDIKCAKLTCLCVK